MKERKLNIGWAQCSITPHQPLLMEGQMYPRVSRYVHDPITATALVLENGETQAIFVSMDMTEVPNHAMPPLKEALAEHGEIRFENISFNVTHTHNSTSYNKVTVIGTAASRVYFHLKAEAVRMGE